MTVAASGPNASPSSQALLDAVGHVVELLSTDPRLSQDVVTRPFPLLAMIARSDAAVILAPAKVWDSGRELLKPFTGKLADGKALLLLMGTPKDTNLTQAINRGLGSILSATPNAEELFVAVTRAFELIDAKTRAEHRGKWLNRYQYEVGQLVDVARAMTTERDVNKLLTLILEKCRFVTGADAGSIYVVEGDEKNPLLRFKFTQNDSVSFDSREFTMPISNRSIAGSAALQKKPINIEDVYELPPGSPYGFDRRFDDRIGYRTKSMLTAPLISQRDEVIGVIQLINKKKDTERKLQSQQDVDEQVIPFDARSEELLGMVAAQAGASLENALLYSEIQQLFEGFVNASVEAIESRDPTTSGHSRRVANLTVALAKAVDKETSGPYKDATFTREDIRELEYASLLHDFGKIGVKEKVLVKAKKLYDERLELIRVRFDYVIKSIEADFLRRKLRAIERGAPKADLEALDKEEASRREEMESWWQAILASNEPTVLAAGDFEKLEAISKETFFTLNGEMKWLLEEEEKTALSVKRGSLTAQEYEEIQSHVVHTFRFLQKIPWGKQLRRVAHIAGAHHERVNGTGYPNRLRAEQIPVQSKMMSIADIYDALTASDRPYKKAVPVERAIDILEYGVKDGHLDVDLVRIFKDARVWSQ
jgi:HD-GYP domain-containing protein (c-di-GMP phosphodiesterase class II)